MMTDISAAPAIPAANSARPYAPSLFDRFTDWVDSLPIPAEGFYAALAAVLVGIQVLIQWDGSTNSVHIFPLIHAAAPAYLLALLHYLDRIAIKALARFRPLLSLDDDTYSRLEYRLTTLPALPALAAVVLGIVYGIWTTYQIPLSTRVSELNFANTPVSIHYDNALIMCISAGGGLAIYHTLRQLRIVEQVYRYCPVINLYALDPLYAFSMLSGRTAVGSMIIVSAWYLFASNLFTFGGIVFGLALFIGFSLLTFVLPLRGAHRLLVEEKVRLLSENGDRMRAAANELHRRVDADSMVDMDNLNKTMASIELEHTTLERVSTWPWEPETFRAVAAALFFPVVVWLLQWLLQRALG